MAGADRRRPHQVETMMAMSMTMLNANLQQLLELTVAGRGQEGLGHLALLSSGACRLLGGLYFPAGAGGEHFGRVGGLAENGADLREGHGEHVVQHERQAFNRAQRVEDRQQREADGVPECNRSSPSGSVVERHGELGQLVVVGDFRAGPA
ncbi:hypothetical protein J1792_18050 [Streptomyces triculaminicus]|uniref:Uncharacterized protein n=2 Tax=Streptomyces TaxID=1883 RepID=A0A939JRB1_9ACTN|nr:hypothetical protein [Streptomyces triculaminicus]QSY49215.1 hypothetical protein J3S04_30335 [Streptomyces griseocarneus]